MSFTVFEFSPLLNFVKQPFLHYNARSYYYLEVD